MAARGDDEDERWRVVLAELVRRARNDDEFRARVEATGAVLDRLEPVIRRRPPNHPSGTGTIACRTYWWGFEIEIPHATLAAWCASGPSSDMIAAAIVVDPGPAAAFVRRTAAWVASRIEELRALDRGAGVYVSMTWMAPAIFLPIPVTAEP
jgi:hypothetical protein